MDDILQSVLDLLKEEKIVGPDVAESGVLDFKQPKELERCIDFSVDKRVVDTKELMEICRKAIKYSVKTSHPRFCNQLYSGVDIYGLAGTWISEALNTNQHTYEVAPVFTLSEIAILKHVRKLFGFETGDGIFAPGGSISNMYGLVLARHQRFPDIKTKGIASVPTLVILTSEESHYSIQKTAHWLGYGTDNVIKVKTDKNGKIIPHDLEMQIVECSRAGKIPIAVNATVGTTVLGAIDPLDDVADICKKYGIWMHVDACFGGSLIFSETHRIRLKGIERSDSIAWNAHKMLGAPLQCAIFITRHENLLQECNTTSANYLFQPDKYYDNAYDTGNKSIQCGRKVDAFKLWVMWKARGDEGFKERVDHLMDCARYFKESIDGREGFRLVLQQFESSNVCFYYIPKSMRGLEEDKEWWDRLYLVAPRMKKLMVFDGAAMIGYSPLKTMGNFWRINFGCEPQPSYKEMDTIIGLFEKYGQDLD